MNGFEKLKAELEMRPYRSLQKQAKAMSLPANVKKAHLVNLIATQRCYPETVLVALINDVKREQMVTRGKTATDVPYRSLSLCIPEKRDMASTRRSAHTLQYRPRCDSSIEDSSSPDRNMNPSSTIINVFTHTTKTVEAPCEDLNEDSYVINNNTPKSSRPRQLEKQCHKLTTTQKYIQTVTLRNYDGTKSIIRAVGNKLGSVQPTLNSKTVIVQGNKVGAAGNTKNIPLVHNYENIYRRQFNPFKTNTISNIASKNKHNIETNDEVIEIIERKQVLQRKQIFKATVRGVIDLSDKVNGHPQNECQSRHVNNNILEENGHCFGNNKATKYPNLMTSVDDKFDNFDIKDCVDRLPLSENLKRLRMSLGKFKRQTQSTVLNSNCMEQENSVVCDDVARHDAPVEICNGGVNNQQASTPSVLGKLYNYENLIQSPLDHVVKTTTSTYCTYSTISCIMATGITNKCNGASSFNNITNNNIYTNGNYQQPYKKRLPTNKLPSFIDLTESFEDFNVTDDYNESHQLYKKDEDTKMSSTVDQTGIFDSAAPNNGLEDPFELLTSQVGDLYQVASPSLGANVTFDNVLETLSIQGANEFLEPVPYQCMVCSWSGPSTSINLHLRLEHSDRVHSVSPDNVCNLSFALGSLIKTDNWTSEILLDWNNTLHVFAVKYKNPDYLYATIYTLGFQDAPKTGSINMYDMITGEPHKWHAILPILPPDINVYADEETAFRISINKLNLLPNSANLKLINGKLMPDSVDDELLNVTVYGKPDLDEIQVIFFVNI